MPYINSNVTLKLSEEKKEKIKSELGKIIETIPGKSEEWLMVGFNDEYSLYFKGLKQEKAAFIQVKILGSTEKKYKEMIVSKISDLFYKEVCIEKQNIYITFEEINDWGWNGIMF